MKKNFKRISTISRLSKTAFKIQKGSQITRLIIGKLKYEEKQYKASLKISS